jgi:hypothetical protein
LNFGCFENFLFLCWWYQPDMASLWKLPWCGCMGVMGGLYPPITPPIPKEPFFFVSLAKGKKPSQIGRYRPFYN